MRHSFEIAGGSVAGRDHVAAGRNNQDAFAWHQDERCTIAVVCDGCSEGPHSEVGANLIARGMVHAIRDAIAHPVVSGGEHGEPDITLALPDDLESVLEKARGDARAVLYDLAMSGIAGSLDAVPRFVRDHLLATTVGCIIARWGTAVFSVGDGVYAVNGVVTPIGPFPGNEPPYLAYDLLPQSTLRRSMALQFQVHTIMPTESASSVLLGTDGVGDFIAAADRNMPGKDELVGPLSQFWTDDRYFRNPDMVRRRLTLVNREAVRVENGMLARTPGLLPDDTTVVVVRRRANLS
ncbi:protein phosphatase 2C domain-containing protein [Candidatus Uhrbacteria bacterium]|nr:protein phosphatase 2C domain-containing protein [Candidatus Uhrbacteria bacterium]